MAIHMCIVRSQRVKLSINLEGLRLQEKWQGILEQSKVLNMNKLAEGIAGRDTKNETIKSDR